MNKYFTRGLLASFIIATVFTFGAFIPASSVKAATITCENLDSILLSLGVTAPDKIAAARVAFGCATVVTPPTSTSTLNQIVPTATIIGTPALSLSVIGQTNNAVLSASFRVSVSALSGADVYLPVNPFNIALVNSQSGNNQSLRSGHTTMAAVNNLVIITRDGSQYYVIPEGDTVTFNVNYSALTSEMFQGIYFARLYGTWISSLQQTVQILPADNASNIMYVTGETSPYISSAAVIVTQGTSSVVKIDGVRLQNSNVEILYNNTVPVNNVTKSTDGTAIKFTINAPAGNYFVQVTDPNNGASNIVGFNVPGIISVYPGFFITSDKPEYSVMDTVALTLSRADNGTDLYPVDVYLQTGDKKVQVVSGLMVGASTIQRIKLSDFGNGAGYYLVFVCEAGKVCGGSNPNTNSFGFNVSPVVVTPSCPLNLTRNLTVGSSGADVTALQNFLGVNPANGYFGAVTKAAVIAYQNAHGISPANGYVGPVMRVFLSKVDICVPPVTPPATNQPPVINGSVFPTTLKVGETGTWSVQASDPENGSLNYSIKWGDEPKFITAVSTNATPITQTSTFTHSYSAPGNYTVVITVQDNAGLTAQTSATVQVNVIPTPVTPAPTPVTPCPANCTCNGDVTTCPVPVTPTPVIVPPTTPVPTLITKPYSNTFSGAVAGSKIFNLGKAVTVSSSNFTWTDNGARCKGSVDVSLNSDSGAWVNKKGWTDVASPASFSLGNLGKVQYIKFSSKDCASYNVSSLKVSGTYQENSTTTSNGASAISGWEGFLMLLRVLR